MVTQHIIKGERRHHRQLYRSLLEAAKNVAASGKRQKKKFNMKTCSACAQKKTWRAWAKRKARLRGAYAAWQAKQIKYLLAQRRRA